MKNIFKLIVVSIIIASSPISTSYAEEDKAQGLDMVTDTAAAIVRKSIALVSGNLEVTTTIDNDRVKNKANYTRNALGDMVPKSTVVNRR